MTDHFIRAEPGDLESIITLTHAAYLPYTVMLGAPPLPVTTDYAPRIAAGEVWLLHRGDAVGSDPVALTGLLVLELHEDHGMIYSVAVAPGFQGQGHGVRLLRHAEKLVRDAGHGEIRLYTNARMERNIALYQSFGYRETGRRPNPHRPGWFIVDMAKPLSRPPWQGNCT
ncbi:GNAT family N-acetyltransferase [Acidisoma cellulosilytica]|uniref:GNAT family N-acetyltransferase n=1 Tax=Acidisoma cellulosilyticum TaxID=2802395 RepID=A0A963YXI5_9PROT|nr:N-acetyltransferase [Acidisoma cellulosilyticum]MCB8878899.1 GNAT family N-acetyltransferase [Acidisoma cellulosilyticum]